MLTTYSTLQQTKSPAKQGTRRIEVIDALRGFTLIGILIIHSYNDFFEITGLASNGESLNILERFLSQAVNHLLSGTLYAVFSFLFGLSFAIQLQNAAKKGKSFKGVFLWRLCILLGIGYLHRLFFTADILRLYAVLGTVLVLCVYLNRKQILVLSGLLFLISVGVRLYYAELPEIVDPTKGSAKDLPFLYVFGLYKIDFLIRSGRLFLIPSLFILGLYAGKIKFFNDNYINRKLHLKIIIWPSLILLSTSGFYMIAKYTGVALPTYVGESVTIIEKTSLSFIFVGLAVILYRIRAGYRLLHWLVPIGKMGLTVYISQSVFLVLFYSLNKEMLTNLGLIAITCITLFVVVLQRQFALWWASHYRYGPIEYIWRRLTYINGTTMASSAQALGSRKASRSFRPNSKCFDTDTDRKA